MTPDLIALPPETLIGPATQPMLPYPPLDAPLVVDGCLLDERVRKGAERCLRFNSEVANAGQGAFEVSYGPSTTGSQFAAMQRIFYSDGSHRDRFATGTEFHPTHAHFHVRDFFVARLWRSTMSGGRLGVSPVARTDKSGFCPEDGHPMQGEEDKQAHYSCLFERERDPGPHQVVGISSGWIDIYYYFMPDQYVEISGVADGVYALELEIDPRDVFVEASEANNRACVVFKLEGTEATLLDPMPRC